MNLSGRVWGATGPEQEASYPCDRLVAAPAEGWTRAVEVAAPADHVFRWLRQLTIAPYSYDWIDFRGQKSPHTLVEGLPELAVGQPLLVFEIAGFETGSHLTGVLPAQRAARHGQMAVSYTVRPLEGGGCRLVVKVVAEAKGALAQRIRRRLLAWGDLVMMRKQLLTFKKLAEQGGIA
ncbi:hypothetical protein HEP86_04035 [Streptomyces sp. RPA4-5]|uniref:hypothetical protein n=1 Tax=Streptomyces TaxID=1883 RepID=UPI00143E8CB7|nr:MULTISPECIES: hypothetical protein [Streptomyces]MCX4637493.1 hypothetical protein [Streptomyces platensis]QIY53805.1 hypothetical protein HEP86_04035 [Streptomyces sp. RPA4-5]WJY36360.1 hypothetical protein QT196_03220 [Streptomyces sp. P9-2B-2]